VNSSPLLNEIHAAHVLKKKGNGTAALTSLLVPAVM